MKLHLATSLGSHRFTGYGSGYVLVNQQRFERPIVVSASQIFENLDALDLESDQSGHRDFLIELKPDILLFGTGNQHRFPSPACRLAFARANIGLESMDTAAACRTFNILIAEERNVIAAVLV